MEWEEYFADGASMVVGAQQRIAGEDKPIRYVNGRYTLRGQSESAWLYDISYEAEGDMLVLTELEQDRRICLPLAQVEYLKLRPFYFAACIGFKAFVFYNQQGIEKGDV